MFAQREFLIARLNKARGRLTELILRAPPDREIYPGWKLKEFVAHVTGWDDSTIQALQAHAKGEPVSQTVLNGIHDYNARAVSARESLDLEKILKEYDHKRLTLIDMLRELPDEKFNVPLNFPWG